MAVTRTPIQVRVNPVVAMTPAALLQEKLEQVKIDQNPEIFVNDMYKQEPNPTWIARKLDINYSSHKLNASACLIRGKHVYDALAAISNCEKKGGPHVHATLRAAIKNGERKGFTEERMWVKFCTVGRSISHKKVDIKARGKMGMIKVPKSSVRITLEEKSPQDFYKMICAGKAPAGVGHIVRKVLYQNDANLKDV